MSTRLTLLLLRLRRRLVEDDGGNIARDGLIESSFTYEMVCRLMEDLLAFGIEVASTDELCNGRPAGDLISKVFVFKGSVCLMSKVIRRSLSFLAAFFMSLLCLNIKSFWASRVRIRESVQYKDDVHFAKDCIIVI